MKSVVYPEPIPSPQMVVFTFRRPVDLFDDGPAAAHGQRFGFLGLFSRDSIQLVLKVDEGKQDRHDQIESKADRLAPVVMIEQLFANLEDYNDP